MTISAVGQNRLPSIHYNRLNPNESPFVTVSQHRFDSEHESVGIILHGVDIFPSTSDS